MKAASDTVQFSACTALTLSKQSNRVAGRLLTAANAIKFPVVSWFISRLRSFGAENTGHAEGIRYDPTCETHTHVADDRLACDRRIASDYLDLDLDRSLANRPSAKAR